MVSIRNRTRSLSVTARKDEEANLLKTCFFACKKAGGGGSKIESPIWGNVGELYSPISGGWVYSADKKEYKVIKI